MADRFVARWDVFNEPSLSDGNSMKIAKARTADAFTSGSSLPAAMLDSNEIMRIWSDR